MVLKHNRCVYLLACVVVAGALILKGFKVDGTVDLILISVVSFFFGLNTPKPKDD